MAPPANSNGTDRRNQIRPRQFMAVVRASGAARQRGVETSGIQNDGRYRTGDFRPSGESDHVEVRFTIVTRSDLLSDARAGGQCGCPYARLSSTDDRGGDRWIEARHCPGLRTSVDNGTAGCGYRGTARLDRSVDFLGKSTFDLVNRAAIDPNRPLESLQKRMPLHCIAREGRASCSMVPRYSLDHVPVACNSRSTIGR